MAPLASIVIPAYNAEETLEETLRSVLAQRGVELEVIVVDDGSKDATAEVAQGFGSPVRVVRQPNMGVGAARNRGIAESRGQYVAFVDADDLWHPDKARLQVERLAAPSQCPECPGDRCLGGLCYTGVRLIDAHSQPLQVSSPWARPGSRPEGWIYRTLLFEGNPITTSSVLVCRQLLARVGDFSTDRTVSEDYDMWLRLSRLAPVCFIPDPLTLYRILDLSYFRADPTVARQRTLKTLQLAVDRFGLERPWDRIRLRRHRAYLYFSIAYELIQLGRDNEAISWLLRSLQEHPLATRSLLHLLSLPLPAAARAHLRRLLKKGDHGPA
jgi:glycosyltransferase involved in cell wall biosynthesis